MSRRRGLSAIRETGRVSKVGQLLSSRGATGAQAWEESQVAVSLDATIAALHAESVKIEATGIKAEMNGNNRRKQRRLERIAVRQFAPQVERILSLFVDNEEDGTSTLPIGSLRLQEFLDTDVTDSQAMTPDGWANLLRQVDQERAGE